MHTGRAGARPGCTKAAKTGLDQATVADRRNPRRDESRRRSRSPRYRYLPRVHVTCCYRHIDPASRLLLHAALPLGLGCSVRVPEPVLNAKASWRTPSQAATGGGGAEQAPRLRQHPTAVHRRAHGPIAVEERGQFELHPRLTSMQKQNKLHPPLPMCPSGFGPAIAQEIGDPNESI